MGVSLDGYVADLNGAHDWALCGGEHRDVTAWKLASLRRAGTHIMGRVTYQEMAAFWPTATGDYAAEMNAIPKVVFSTTLESADWADTRIARGELTREVEALTAAPGGDIIAHGGARFAQALSHSGLVDEYRLVVCPVVVSAGMPLFKDLRAAPSRHRRDTRLPRRHRHPRLSPEAGRAMRELMLSARITVNHT